MFCLANGTALVELLLNAGADLNATTAWGDTAAHYAALTGTLEVLRYLIEAGVSITSNKALQAEGWRLSQKFPIGEVCSQKSEAQEATLKTGRARTK